MTQPSDNKKPCCCFRDLLGPLFLILVVLLLLGFEYRDGGIHLGALFSDGKYVLSMTGTDVQMQFVPWREFGFTQMRHGHFPLWNPHLFSGTPYAGALQAALLYPLNWIFLFLPVGIAVNWNIATHVMLAGIAMYCWARYRRVSRVGSTLAGMTYMLSGQFYLHIMPGHLPFLCAAAWSPLVMMCCDGLLDLIHLYDKPAAPTRSEDRYVMSGGSHKHVIPVTIWPYLRWVLFGAFLVAMQVFCGYPQPVYNTCFVASLYLVLNLFAAPLLDRWIRRQKKTFNPRHATRAIISWFVLWLLGALISAVWLGAGAATHAESGRAGGTPFEFAASYFLPWQNLITLIVPNFWGGVASAPAYTSEWLVWEVIVFIGAAASSLALMSLVAVNSKSRRFSFGIAIFCILLALGSQTPLFRVMFDLIPGFSNFRGSAKWAWNATILISMMTAFGWDALLQRPKKTYLVAILMIVIGASIGIFGLKIAHSDLWMRIGAWTDSHSMQSIKVPTNPSPEQIHQLEELQKTKTQVVAHDLFSNSEFIKTSGTYAAKQCGYAFGACLVAAACLLATRLSPHARWGLAALLCVEMTFWAQSTYCKTLAKPDFPKEWLAQKDRLDKEDARAIILSTEFANLGMNVGIDSIWGYDPVMLRRYLQFVAATQGFDPGAVVDYSSIMLRNPTSPYLAMLRARCVLYVNPDHQAVVADIPAPLPRLLLVGEYKFAVGRDQVMQSMAGGGFFPRSVVVLEDEPDTKPTGAEGDAKVVRETTDEIEIEVNAKQPTLLLMTDPYSTGWHARALPDSQERHYSVLPANWVLRAVPLTAGKHHFVMEYMPAEYVIGKWISIVTLPLYLLAVIVACFKRRSAITGSV